MYFLYFQSLKDYQHVWGPWHEQEKWFSFPFQDGSSYSMTNKVQETRSKHFIDKETLPLWTTARQAGPCYWGCSFLYISLTHSNH